MVAVVTKNISLTAFLPLFVLLYPGNICISFSTIIISLIYTYISLFFFLSQNKTDASLSEDLSRTGSPHNIHGDSDSDGNDAHHHPHSLLHHHARRAAAAAAEHHQRSSSLHHPLGHTAGSGGNGGGNNTLSPVMAGAGLVHSALAASAAAASAGGLLSSVHPSTVSLGPPLPPPPHLLPYLYPGAGLYPGGPSLHQLSQLLHHHHHPPGMLNSAAAAAHMGHMGHNLLLNAQLALAAQHQLFHPHAYQNLSAATLAAAAAASASSAAAAASAAPPLPPAPPVLPTTTTSSGGGSSSRGQSHRFAPYSLGNSPKSSSGGSAFETVSPKTSPPLQQRSPPAPITPTSSHPSSPAPITSSTNTKSPASDLRNIEKMVNGLDAAGESPADVKPAIVAVESK